MTQLGANSAYGAKAFRASSTRQRRPAEKLLKPVRPNAGIEALYRKRLDTLIAEMAASVEYFTKAAYRANEPATIAQDETAAESIQRAMRDLSRRWNKRFNIASERLAKWFAQSTEKRSSDALRKILKDGGFTIDFHMTPAMRDIVGATVNANVALIKSIPSQYLGQVEGMVMRSVQTGRDLGGLAKELQQQLGVTKRRAALIAHSQNNLATSAMNKARQIEAGLTEAVWIHSGGGKTQRPSHVKAGREREKYKIADGWYDPHEKKHIQPGELIACRCVGRAVVKGFT